MKHLVRSTLLLSMSFAVLAGALPASAEAVPRPFRASVTEEFVFFGCAVPPSPSADLCGTAEVEGLGAATIETTILRFQSAPGTNCFIDEHSTTFIFVDQSGSLSLQITGLLCPDDSGQNFHFTGVYRVSSGIGAYQGARGAGSVLGARHDGPVESTFTGILVTR